MQTQHFEIQINAPREKVWETMLGDATYREWTNAFHEGSYYKGDWSKGSTMYFIGPSEGGAEGGMVSEIADNRLHEFVSIKHVGFINNGVEDRESDEVKKWVPAFENYTFIDAEGGTLVAVDIDTNEEYSAMFAEMWPKALLKLKEIAEK